MAILKQHNTAVVLVAALCVLLTLFGTGRSLRQAAAKVETLYEKGVDGSGYGISGDLSKRIDLARNLCTVAEKYDDATILADSDAVRTAAANLDAASGAADQYAANQSLTDAVETLSAAMTTIALSDKDEQYRSQLYTDLTSRNDTISHEAAKYNEKVRSFNSSVLGAFPASFLRIPAGVSELEVFG